MSRTRNKIIATLVAVLATAALVPAASVASTDAGGRTQTELGQAVGEPADRPIPGERTQTELGQAVGEPANQGSAAANARYSRTSTELGQQVATPVMPDVTSVAPEADSSGFDWRDAAIGAGAMLTLIGFGGALAVALVNRRRQELGDSGVPAVSS
jgi:hypothetical protein